MKKILLSLAAAALSINAISAEITLNKKVIDRKTHKLYRYDIANGKYKQSFNYIVFNKKDGTVSLANALRDRYEKLSQLLLTDNVTLYDIERAFDSIYSDLIRSARSVQTGAEVVAGYAAAIEKEVQSVRILITGKKLSVSPEKLIERLGEYYV